MRIYNEMDLLTAESLRAGLWDGLDPSGLAAVLSTLVYESRRARRRRRRRACPVARSSGCSPTWSRSGPTSTPWSASTTSTSSTSPTSGSRGRRTAGPRATSSTTSSTTTDLAAGDFVRWVKQLLDLADQVADASAESALRKIAREASKRLRRGVVAYSSVSE